MNKKENKTEESLRQLKQIYRLRQLQGVIPFTVTFEEYIVFLKELYGLK